MSNRIKLATFFAFLIPIVVFQNCTRMNSAPYVAPEVALTDGGPNPIPTRQQAFTPQPVSSYDPRHRFIFGKADLDGNGVRDSFYLDRNTGHVNVRLFGAFPANHPYAGVDQQACTHLAWAFNNNPVPNQPNLDYCNAVTRPEENWATVGLLDAKNDFIQIFSGHVFDPTNEALIIWDQSRLIFAKAQPIPDPIGLRPNIKMMMSLKTAVLDLSTLDICQSSGLPSSELAACAGQRWKNLARPWEKTVLTDLNGDGVDDLIGVVAVDDTDPNTNVGLWALVSNKGDDGSIRYRPVLLTLLSNNYRGENFSVGDFEGLGTPQIVFTRADLQVLSEIRLGCLQSFSSGQGCAKLTALGSTAVNLDTGLTGTGAISIDEVASGHFLNSMGSVQLRFRAKRASRTVAQYYLLSFSSGKPVLSAWNCLWQPSPLDSNDANWACLTSNPSDSATHSQTIGDCGSDGRAAIQSALDNPSIRNVILSAVNCPVSGTLNVSTLDANGNPIPGMTKRLIGKGTTISASNPYYSQNPDGTFSATPAAPNEAATFDKCREFRPAVDGDLFTALSTRKILSHCGVIQTLGSNITISSLNIDTTRLSQITASKPIDQVHPGNALPMMHSILLGYYAYGWAWPYDGGGVPNKSLTFRQLDTSHAPDENIRLENLNLQNIDVAGVATYATPIPVRDVLVEDIICRPYDPARALTLSDCIDLNSTNNPSWPFDASYRQFVPFGPPPVENFHIRKGPHASSACDMVANSQTVRVSGAIGFVLENCRVQKGYANDGIFLYVTDTGAKLDATLRGDTVVMDPATPSYGRYNLKQPSFIPARFDANNNEIFQDSSVLNDPLITVSGRSMTESVSFNYRTDLAPDILVDPDHPQKGSQLDANRRMNAYALMFRKLYQYRETPSQVLIDGLTSQINMTGNDALYRVHIKENFALSGKFICRNCSFSGGGMVMSAALADLWAYVTNCINDPAPGGDTHLLTKDQQACSGKTAQSGRSRAPGIVKTLGYDSAGNAVTALDPNGIYAREHGQYFEFINATQTGLHQPSSIVIRPGAWDGGTDTKIPNTTSPFSTVIAAP